MLTDKELAEYAENDLRHPSAWEAIFDIRIIDPDGWRHPYNKSFDEEISAHEFSRRGSISTVSNGPKRRALWV